MFDPQYIPVDIDGESIFKTQLEKNLRLPIFEDEEGDGIYGYGNIDPRLFASYANLYDIHTTGDVLDDGYTEEDVKVGWFRSIRREDMLDDEYFRFQPLQVELWDNTPETGKIMMTWIDR